MRLVDMTGQKCNALTVIAFAVMWKRKAYWRCLCDCGRSTVACGIQLRNGNTKSCGCRRVEAMRKTARTHGRTGSKDYNNEREKARVQRHYESNNESFFAKRAVVLRQYKEANREKVREWNRDYKKRHPGKINADTRARQALAIQAMPAWADKKAIKAIYVEAARLTCETGVPHHVDHKMPLRGKTVSGFHIETNLQILPAVVNLKKSNKVML